MKFVSFHTHTTYSYGDGFGTVKEHVQRVSDLGMSALALSEHGNVNSHAALERECRTIGIKPIFGIEAYLGPVGDKRTQSKTHITLFAQNAEGYHNLNKLVTQSYIDSHYFPTVSVQNLRKHAAGLIAFSGCSDSLISCTLLGGKFLGERRELISDESFRNTGRKISWFCDVFGPERFFLEVQRFPALDRTCQINPAFAKLGNEYGVSLVATADVHYPYSHQNEMQKVLHASRRSGSVAINEQTWEYDIKLTYPESDQEIIDDLKATGLSASDALHAVERTAKIAETCNVDLPKARPLRYPLSIGETAQGHLKQKLKEGWATRTAQRPDLKGRIKEYNARLNKELRVIVEKDFCDYFLATADLVTYAKSSDVTVGPGRGSAAGSVVCYVLGITEIDPLHPTFNRMVFERFIDPTRPDMPDIDLDFDDELRYKIPERAREIYGQENVCNIANHIGYRAKNSLSGVAKAYGLPFKIFDPIGRRTDIRVETDDRVDDSILDVLESYRNDPTIASLVDVHGDKIRQACQLEGGEHSMGTHAGGFVISSEAITEVCPIYTKRTGTGRNVKTIQVIPYEKRDAEHLGMLKMDFLGLTTMGVVGKIREWTGIPLDALYSLYYNDFAQGGDLNNTIMQKFLDDDLTGIFQYEGNTTRAVVAGVMPTNFDELAACNALSRPGPYYGGQTKEYIAVKNGQKDWERIGKGFDEHVEWTYGQIVYQEQIMFILRDLAGFDIPKVLRVRKIIGKKLGEHQFAELWNDFSNGCAANGVSEDAIRRVWGAITTAAGYAFNTAHAYSYAIIAWWSMYFKIEHTKEFFAATLAKNGDGKDDLPRRTALLKDAVDHDISIGKINLTGSDQNWRPFLKGPGILPGFMQIPGIAQATADDIVKCLDDFAEERTPTWIDLMKVPGLGENTIVKMYEFTLKEDPFNVTKTEKQLGAFRKESERGDYQQFGLPHSDEFRSSNDIPTDAGVCAFVGLVSNILQRDEADTQRKRTGDSLENIHSKLDAKGAEGQYKKATLFAYDEFGEVALRVSRFRYGQLSTKLESIKEDHSIVAVWGRTFDGKENSIQVTDMWVLEPD